MGGRRFEGRRTIDHHVQIKVREHLRELVVDLLLLVVQRIPAPQNFFGLGRQVPRPGLDRSPPIAPVWKSTSDGDNVASMAWNRHAIAQT